MSFYTPKTDAQLQEESLLPAGDYDFKVLEAEEKSSSKGNPMLAVKLQVMSDSGSRIINDYIVPSTNFGERKLRRFAQALGLESEYTSGDLTADLVVGKFGRVAIGQQEASGGYDAKNVVSGLGYIESAGGPF